MALLVRTCRHQHEGSATATNQFKKEEDVAEHVVATDSTGTEGENGAGAGYAGRRATLGAVCAALAFGTSLYAVTRSVRACGARKRTAWMALAAITAGEGMGVLSTLPPLEGATVTDAGIAAWSVGLVLHAWDVFLRKPITDADVEREVERLRRRSGGAPAA
jgi:hypothetical protein